MPAVSWGAKPSKKAVEENLPASKAALDRFVNPETAKPTKRLNAEIPADLHARIKAQCALDGRDMTDVLIELLESRFPAR
jgi:hypothetical protein